MMSVRDAVEGVGKAVLASEHEYFVQLAIDDHEHIPQVFAVRSGVAHGLARFRSSDDQGASLRNELYSLARKRRRVVIGDVEYELRARVYESFGEDAFQVELRRIWQ